MINLKKLNRRLEANKPFLAQLEIKGVISHSQDETVSHTSRDYFHKKTPSS